MMMALVGVLPTTGNIAIDDLVVEKKNLVELRQRIGMVFQNPDDQLFMATIYDDIAFGLRNQGISESEVKQKIAYFGQLLGITHLLDKTALRLSGGEKRLVALASVLVMEPQIMLFDEPTAFLDTRARRALIGLLQQLPQGKLIATHDFTFALETCQQALVIHRGKIVAQGPCKELLYNQQLLAQYEIEGLGGGI